MRTMQSMLSAALILISVTGTFHPEARPTEPTKRVLIVSIPGTSWNDIERLNLPNFTSVFERSAIANLVPRSVRSNSRASDAYLTIGAGSRATGTGNDGAELQRNETFEDKPATAAFQDRNNIRPANAEVLAMPWIELIDKNEDETFDAELGKFASVLRDHDVNLSVIANADQTLETTDFYREAALALAQDGRVQNGIVSDALLQADTDGVVQYDPEAVMSAFQTAWNGSDNALVLLEMSDLARALQQSARQQLDEALVQADELFGRMLEEVDFERDNVMVLSPYDTIDAKNVQAVSIAGPGIDTGFLQSATNQRAGLISLVDIAPTLLDRFGIETPNSMEGRTAKVVNAPSGYADRVAELTDMRTAAGIRGEKLHIANAVLFLLVILVAISLLAQRLHSLVSPLALLGIIALPASFLTNLVSEARLETDRYLLIWAVISGALFLATSLVTNDWTDRFLIASALCLAVPLTDAMTGAHLQFSAPFGYTPAGNSRTYGVSNYSFAMIGGAAIALGCLLFARLRRYTALSASALVFVLVLLVLGTPTWGADVGGVLAWAPSALLTWLLLANVRIRLRWIIAVAASALVAIAGFGILDFSRPRNNRTHLGRFLQQIADDGFGTLSETIGRKGGNAFHASITSLWSLTAVLVVFTAVVVFQKHPETVHRLRTHSLPVNAFIVGIITVAVLGSILNDSGLIVGGLVLFIGGFVFAGLSSIHMQIRSEIPDNSAVF